MQFVAKNGTVGGEPIRGYDEGKPYDNQLPITTLAVDRVTFPVEGAAAAPANENRDIPPWQRWNDYGIGLLLKGKAQLRQAEQAFTEVEKLNRYDGPLNLARVYFTEGRLSEATEALQRAGDYTDPPAPPWTLAWLTGQVNQQQGLLEDAEAAFRKALEDRTPEMIKRKFDFSRDYEVRNQLGSVLFDQARQIRGEERKAERDALLRRAATEFERTLEIDSEHAVAHYNLFQLYSQLGDAQKAEQHSQAHQRYKLDDNAADRAVRLAREKYPAGNHAAEAIVIYSLHRPGAPELPPDATIAGAGRRGGSAGGGN
jgi:tetratricopeptide (TPR) repeat protein